MATILFLGANPTSTARLALGEEEREIDQRLLAAPERDVFRIEQAWAVRAADLQQVLLRHRPAVVHFSGHGSRAGQILLDDASGTATPVPPRALARLFQILGREDRIRCVVLNACYSEAHAQAIVEHVDVVIGMSTAVADWAAIAFAGAFYQALGHGEDAQTAFDLGCNQIELVSAQRRPGGTRDLNAEDGVTFSQAAIPRLLVREGVQARDVRLAPRKAPPPPPPSRPPPSVPPPSVRSAGVFVGRKAELRALEDALLPASGASRPIAVCALRGMPGVGKSYLAEHFAAEHLASFPGGFVRLVLRPDDDRAPADIEASLLGELADRFRLPAAVPDLAARIRARLLHPRTLLHLENIDALAPARAAIALVSALRGCPIVVTGRYQDLGVSAGWSRIALAPFDETTSLSQLEAEIHPVRSAAEREAFRRLASELGRLPLALHLAAAYLREGDFTVDTFLMHLRTRALDIEAGDPADHPVRASLPRTFGLSLDLLRRQLGEDGDALVAAFAALGHAPLAGFGRSLGAAIAGLAPVDFDRLVRAARQLSLLMQRDGGSTPEPRWYIHPLLAELLCRQPGTDAARARMAAWFLERLPELPAGQEAAQGERWKEIHEESPALVAWLHALSGEELVRAVDVGKFYAKRNGPFAAWLGLHERALASAVEPEDRSNLLWAFMYVARHAGALDTALALATEKEAFEKAVGHAQRAALAAGCRADILETRGKLDEALRIRQEEQLPVYEKLGDVRERAVTMGRITDILQARGRLDEALRIRQEEQLPVFEKLGDVRERAVTMGKIADVLQARGELDEALRIQEEQLLVFEKLGNVRLRAVTMGKIAGILQARGKLDEALRIRLEEQLPVYEQLGAVRDLLVTRVDIALNLLARGAAGDRDAAAHLLQLAYHAAQSLRIPEADQIRRTQQRHGLLPPD